MQPSEFIRREGRQFGIDAHTGTIRFGTTESGHVLPPEDLTARDGRADGELANHDGSGLGDEGLHRWDASGSEWVFTEGSGTV